MIEFTPKEFITLLSAVAGGVWFSVWKILRHFEKRRGENGIEGIVRTFLLSQENFLDKQKDAAMELVHSLRGLSKDMTRVEGKVDILMQRR
jgi:hypothetical protein